MTPPETATTGDYGAPMLQMISLIGEKEDAESLKDMALYARSALDHQLDVKIPSADPERQEEFQQYVTDQAVKDRVAVNITDLDASGFETVTAEFQFDAGGERRRYTGSDQSRGLRRGDLLITSWKRFSTIRPGCFSAVMCPEVWQVSL